MKKLVLIIGLCAALYSISIKGQSKIEKVAKRKPMTERAFTELYVSGLAKNYPLIKHKIIGDLTIEADYNGNIISHYLDNTYNQYLMQPDAVDDLLERYIASSGDLYKDPLPINTSNIVPVIKPIQYLEDLKKLHKQNDGEKESWIVYEKYNSALIIVYGENTETSIRYFTQDDLNKLSVSRDSLHPLAIGNLNKILPKIKRNGDNGTFMLTAGGDFESSLILLTDIWTTDNFKVKGDIVVAIPNRDMLMVTGSKDEQGIKTIRDVTIESFATGNPLSPYLFKWDGKKFEHWK